MLNDDVMPMNEDKEYERRRSLSWSVYVLMCAGSVVNTGVL